MEGLDICIDAVNIGAHQCQSRRLLSRGEFESKVLLADLRDEEPSQHSCMAIHQVLVGCSGDLESC